MPDRRLRSSWGAASLLWFLAFAHRVFLLLGNRDRSWPFPVFYEGDAETFHHYALAILRGASYDAGVPFHPPLFPHFLAALHGLMGEGAPQPALRLILAAVFSLQAPLLYALLRRFLSFGPALAGTLLAVYSFGLSLVSIAAVSEGLYLLWLLAALILFCDLRWEAAPARRIDNRRALGLGASLGLCALTRAEGLGVALVLLCWGAHSGWKKRASVRGAGPARGLRNWLVAAATLVAVLLPWTIRNAVTLSAANRAMAGEGVPRLGTLVVTTAYGPLNFALANHERAPGYFTRSLLTRGLQEGTLDLRDPQHRDYFVHGYRRGLSFIGEHPQAFLRLLGRKLALLARALRTGWTQWDLPGGLKGTRYPVDLFTPDSTAAVWVHLALLAPGVWLLLAQRKVPRRWVSERGDPGFLLLVLALVLLTVVATAAFFGYARQGVLLLPLFFGVEGVTVAALARGVGARVRWLARPVRWLARPLRRDSVASDTPAAFPRGVWAVIVLLFLVELAGAFQDRNYIASGETQAGSRMLNRDSIMHLQRAE